MTTKKNSGFASLLKYIAPAAVSVTGVEVHIAVHESRISALEVEKNILFDQKAAAKEVSDLKNDLLITNENLLTLTKDQADMSGRFNMHILQCRE